MKYQYGVRRNDGRFSLHRVGRWSPSWKSVHIRYLLPEFARKYLAMPDLGACTSDLHIFKSGANQ